MGQRGVGLATTGLGWKSGGGGGCAWGVLTATSADGGLHVRRHGLGSTLGCHSSSVSVMTTVRGLRGLAWRGGRVGGGVWSRFFFIQPSIDVLEV